MISKQSGELTLRNTGRRLDADDRFRQPRPLPRRQGRRHPVRRNLRSRIARPGV